MNLLDATMVLVCAATAVAYACRLDHMSIFNTRAPYVLFHLFWMLHTGWLGFEFWQGRAFDFHVLPLGGALLWLWISWPTWRGGKVPSHWLRNPPKRTLQVIQGDVLRRVVGGSSEP